MIWRNKLSKLLSDRGPVAWIRSDIESLDGRTESIRRCMVEAESARLKRELQTETPANPALFGYGVFSQYDEDGILDHIFRRLPGGRSDASRCFLEIGCGDGRENNTHWKLLQGWRGTWIDGDRQNIAFIEQALGGVEHSRLHVHHAFVTLDNIETVTRAACERWQRASLDLLSIDVDGNDSHLAPRAISIASPAVVCIEYNAKFPPGLAIEMPYDEGHLWAHDDFHGASLSALVSALRGYTLVACNIAGVNAFFVKTELMAQLETYAPDKLYQPARYHLFQSQRAHPSSLKWLKHCLRHG